MDPQPPILQQSTQPVYTRPKRGGLPWWAIILIVVWCLLMVAITSVFVVQGAITAVATAQAQKVGRQFVDYVQASNVPAAYTLTDDAFKRDMSEREFAKIVHNASPRYQGSEYLASSTVNKFFGTPTEVTLHYEIDASNATIDMDLKLKKYGDTWQVSHVHSN